MPTERILTSTALIERDLGSTPDTVGDLAPSWSTIASAEPCAPAQPMTDRLKRMVSGDVAVTDYLTITGIAANIAKGDRLTIDGVAYRAEAVRAWTSGTARVHHVEVGMTVL
jgi:hypothetical protein